MGIAKQIIGSLGDIGSEIVKEAVSVPKDMVGTVLESLGTPKSQKGQQQVHAPTIPSEVKQFGSFDGTKEEKKVVARAALQALAQGKSVQKEPSVYEKNQKELEEKKQRIEKQTAAERQNVLPTMSSKRKRGDLYGMKAKKAGSEIGKNVKAE